MRQTSGPGIMALFLLTAAQAAAEPANNVERLWPGRAPLATGDGEADTPTLTVTLPPAGKATGAAVVVMPGGGYHHLALDHEGAQIATWLAARGAAAFVLRYRVAPYRDPAPLTDGLRALRFVRARAARYGVKPDRIGVWGFSAGGHLASCVATLFDEGDARAADPIQRVSARPDFAVLAYALITMVGEGRHAGATARLLGEAPSPEALERLSTERQISPRTPPTFIFHTSDDATVPVANALAFYRGLRAAGVAAELHVYEHGRHGLGLAPADPVLSSWGGRLQDWLRARGALK